MNRGKYQRLPADEVKNNHARIIELKEQGVPLTKIAKELKTTYGSVLYVVYRKPNQLWQ